MQQGPPIQDPSAQRAQRARQAQQAQRAPWRARCAGSRRARAGSASPPCPSLRPSAQCQSCRCLRAEPAAAAAALCAAAAARSSALVALRERLQGKSLPSRQAFARPRGQPVHGPGSLTPLCSTPPLLAVRVSCPAAGARCPPRQPAPPPPPTTTHTPTSAALHVLGAPLWPCLLAGSCSALLLGPPLLQHRRNRRLLADIVKPAAEAAPLTRAALSQLAIRPGARPPLAAAAEAAPSQLFVLLAGRLRRPFEKA